MNSGHLIILKLYVSQHNMYTSQE